MAGKSVAVAVPLKEGAYEFIRQHRDEIVHGLDGLDHDTHARDQRGFKVMRMYHQTVPTEALIFYFESDDIDEALHPRHNDHESSQKWDAFFQQVAGLEGHFLTEMPELLLDWHHEEGHRQKSARPAR